MPPQTPQTPATLQPPRPSSSADDVTVRDPGGKLYSLSRTDLPRALKQGFQLYDPSNPPKSSSLWGRLWSPLASSKDVQASMSAQTFGAFSPELAEAAANKEIAKGNPVRARLFSFAGGVEKSTADFLSSLTSPGSLALMALSGGESAATKALPEAKTLLTMLRIPQRAAAAAFGIEGVAQMATPQQEGETKADALERRLMGASAAVGATAATASGVRASFSKFLRRYFGLNDDLAAKVANQTRQITETKQAAARAEEGANLEYAKKVAPVADTLLKGMQQVGLDTSSQLTRIEQGLEAEMSRAQSRLTELDKAKVKAGAQVVSDGLQAMLSEQAKVRVPFQEIGEAIKEPVTDAKAVRGLVLKEALAKGVKEGEVPSAAFKALGKAPETEGGATRALTESEKRAALLARDVLDKGGTEADARSAMTNLGYVPKQVEAIMGALGISSADVPVTFNDLTRVREDVYDAADSAKDGNVKAALMSAYNRLTDMQEKAADAAKLGLQYKAAKAAYLKFRRGIGSGMMQDWLSARDAQEQAITPKIAKLFTPSTAEALRATLKAAGVDVAPLDGVLQEMQQVREGIRRGPALAKQEARDVVKGAETQVKTLQQDASRQRKELQGQRREQVRGIRQAARSQVTELEEKGQIIPKRTTSELAGKSNPELLRERLQAQATRMESSGMRNPMAFVMTVYGLVRMASGSLFGLFPLSYGVTRGELPSLIANPKFQDWVFKTTGVEDKAGQARVRRGLLALRPILERMIKTGVPEAAAAGDANTH